MLTPYCTNVLKIELGKAEYNGLTPDQAWTWLMEEDITRSEVDTHTLLTPLRATAVLGPLKANALAVKVQATIPAIASSLMNVGVDLSDPATGQFLDFLVDGTTVIQADVNALKALGKKTVETIRPRRFEKRFDPGLWKHVASDGTRGTEEDQAIHGFPNTLDRADFDNCWRAVRD